ncbi:MAG: NAD(P)-dependent alcohol dehydrogenase [Chitinophagia bacterium]|nr:NAD(P)-dependent alcohol dehydrogenase [Chitinophagia bacterium]
MPQVKAYAAQDSKAALAPLSIERRALNANDVQVEIHYCGVCHSDIHTARNEWGGTVYPVVPGHEIVGIVKGIGSAVTKFKVGQTVGVGVMVDSCRVCPNCKSNFEQYCQEGMTGTYNALERNGSGKRTMGGYSAEIITDENYVLNVQEKENLAGVAPLLCAGITTYSPLKFANVKKGTKVAVVGLGGLGHMAVKFAVAFGAEVTVISTSPSKVAEANKLGAHHFILAKDADALKPYDSSFDVVLDAISADHDYTQYLNLLRLEGKLLVVGLPEHNPKVSPFALIKNRRSIVGSMIGSIKETQEMLDFCYENKIYAEIEKISIASINDAYERMIKGDIKYRFVIDMSTL